MKLQIECVRQVWHGRFCVRQFWHIGVPELMITSVFISYGAMPKSRPDWARPSQTLWTAGGRAAPPARVVFVP